VGGTSEEKLTVGVPTMRTLRSPVPLSSVRVRVTFSCMDFTSGLPSGTNCPSDEEVPSERDTAPSGAVRLTSKVTAWDCRMAPVQPSGVV